MDRRIGARATVSEADRMSPAEVMLLLVDILREIDSRWPVRLVEGTQHRVPIILEGARQSLGQNDVLSASNALLQAIGALEWEAQSNPARAHDCSTLAEQLGLLLDQLGIY